VSCGLSKFNLTRTCIIHGLSEPNPFFFHNKENQFLNSA